MERLLEYFNPTQYDLELFVFSQQEYIQGTVRIEGILNGNIAKFHAVNMEIQEVTFQAQHWQGSDITPARTCTYKYDGRTIGITLDDQMQRDLDQVHAVNMKEDYEDGRLTVFTIKYKTDLNHNMQGCYVSTYDFNGAPQKLIATQFESHYAREAFPCIDEPAAKAIFNLTLLTPNRQPADVVLANTALVKQDYNRFEFEPTPRMSTYLLAWVIGPLKSISAVNRGGVKVTSYAALNQSTTSLEFANEVAARALDYYDQKFGIKYPLSKLDQVALPDFEAGAMENWGLVTYRESCLLADLNSSIDTKQSVAVTITHELSHQWFGDLVTMAWWDDLWLNESFATIMEYCATDALYPEFKVWQEFFTGDCIAALRRDCLPGVQSVQQAVHDPAEIATLFDGAIVYAKGARLVLMLMRAMGEDNFYRGVHDYFEEYKYQNTVGDDLWTKLQPYAKFNIKDFMHAWISQPGYPALQESHNGDKTWWAQQRFFVNGTTDDSKWPLPEVQDDMSGHYLIDLGDKAFHQKLTDFAKLTAEQKLRLLIDRMLLAKSGIVDSSSLLEILPKFVDEDAPIWDVLLTIINDLKIFFPHDSAPEDQYRAFLRQAIHDRVRTIGVTTSLSDSENIKRLRSILAVVARFAKDPEIIDQLAAQYSPDLTAIDSEMRGNILMAKMITDERTFFPTLLEKYQSEVDPELRDDILCALASARSGKNIATVIKLLEQPEIVRPQDHLFLFIYILRNPKARTRGLDWLYGHWNLIERLTGEKSIEDYPRCMAGYIDTEEEFQAFTDFFRQHESNPVLKRTIAMAKASIRAKLDLIAHQGSAVQAKLQQLAGK